jgi:hypothetical protein
MCSEARTEDLGTGWDISEGERVGDTESVAWGPSQRQTESTGSIETLATPRQRKIILYIYSLLRMTTKKTGELSELEFVATDKGGSAV